VSLFVSYSYSVSVGVAVVDALHDILRTGRCVLTFHVCCLCGLKVSSILLPKVCEALHITGFLL